MYTLIRFSHIISIILLVVSVGHAQSWELVKETDEMSVHVREDDSNNLKEVKIVSAIKCPMNELVMALEDVESHKDWVKSTIDSKLIEKQGPANFHYYISTDMPYPVKDRDVVISYSRTQDAVTKVVTNTYENIDGKMDKQKKFVRVPFFRAGYTLTPDENGTIGLTYTFKIDAGGSIPQWIVNMAVTKGPVDTIESLFELIKSGHYKGADAQGVEEL